MAYFHCLIGGGSSGGGYELTVTCDSAFASSTITCTDGTTTLTQTCPSSSPYEVVFEIPNGGDWTISGTTGGHTVSTGVSIPTSAELIATIQQTVTIYSAKEDTISYVDIDGATQTITFASGETSKQVTIEIEASGSSITFTSGVAKDPNNLSNYYSKTVTITSNTTEIYLMPDNTLYWWGYMSDNAESVIASNGWSWTNFSMPAPTYNTNDVYWGNQTGEKGGGIGTKNKVSNISKCHVVWSGSPSGNSWINMTNSKNTNDEVSGTHNVLALNTANTQVYQYHAYDNIDAYIEWLTLRTAWGRLNALWYE